MLRLREVRAGYGGREVLHGELVHGLRAVQ